MVFGWLEGWFSSTVEEEEDLGPDPSIELMKEEIRELLETYPSEAFPFENIAFEGGGVKGLAHAGGLRVSSACAMLFYANLLLNPYSFIFDAFSMRNFPFPMPFIYFIAAVV